MSDIFLCSTHQNCTIKNKCRRYLEIPVKPKKKQMKEYSYYANSCNGFLEQLSDQELRDLIGDDRVQLYRDLHT